MNRCWNGYCISDNCDGVNHVGIAGDTWAQRIGESYCPTCCEYHYHKETPRAEG